MRRVLVGGLAALMLWLAGSYLGGRFAPADSLAVARREVALLCGLLALVALWAGPRRWGAAALVSAVLSGGPIVAGMFREGEPGGLVLYQKNVWVRNGTPEAVLAEIRALSPDLVTLQEVTAEFDGVIAALATDYPVQVRCRSGVWILSRLPPGPEGSVCPQERRQQMVALQVVGPEGPVWVVALHLLWPWPKDQAAQVGLILPEIAALDGPVIVAGDFNMVAWGASLRQIASAAGAHRIGRIARTYDFGTPLVRLGIDHVLVPEGWTGTTEVRALAGSDHFGVLARIGP